MLLVPYLDKLKIKFFNCGFISDGYQIMGGTKKGEGGNEEGKEGKHLDM